MNELIFLEILSCESWWCFFKITLNLLLKHVHFYVRMGSTPHRAVNLAAKGTSYKTYYHCQNKVEHSIQHNYFILIHVLHTCVTWFGSNWCSTRLRRWNAYGTGLSSIPSFIVPKCKMLILSIRWSQTWRPFWI